MTDLRSTPAAIRIPIHKRPRILASPTWSQSQVSVRGEDPSYAGHHTVHLTPIVCDSHCQGPHRCLPSSKCQCGPNWVQLTAEAAIELNFSRSPKAPEAQALTTGRLLQISLQRAARPAFSDAPQRGVLVNRGVRGARWSRVSGCVDCTRASNS